MITPYRNSVQPYKLYERKVYFLPKEIVKSGLCITAPAIALINISVILDVIYGATFNELLYKHSCIDFILFRIMLVLIWILPIEYKNMIFEYKDGVLQ